MTHPKSTGERREFFIDTKESTIFGLTYVGTNPLHKFDDRYIRAVELLPGETICPAGSVCVSRESLREAIKKHTQREYGGDCSWKELDEVSLYFELFGKEA